MSRVYSVSFAGVTKSGVQDLFAIYVGAIPVRIREIAIISYNATADNTNLDLIALRHTGTIYAGSGGTTPTPAPLQSTNPAASFSAHVNDTTQVSSTGTTYLLAYGVDVDKGLIYTPPVDLCPILNPGEVWSIGGGASAGSDNLAGYVLVEELS